MSKECIETRNGYFNVVNVESCTMKNVCIYVKRLDTRNKELEDKIKYLKSKIENKDKWCQLIADIAYDYDGYNDAKNLKALIDELVGYALYARDDHEYEDFLLEGNDE